MFYLCERFALKSNLKALTVSSLQVFTGEKQNTSPGNVHESFLSTGHAVSQLLMETEMKYSAKSDDAGTNQPGEYGEEQETEGAAQSHGIRWVSRDRKKEQGCRKGRFRSRALRCGCIPVRLQRIVIFLIRGGQNTRNSPLSLQQG